jgi:uncharacterized protein (DUF983 family)
MADIADLLMLRGVARRCPDCHDECIFVPTAAPDDGEYCCTRCGAALLIDPAIEPPASIVRVA